MWTQGNGSVPTTGAGIQVYDNYHVSVVGAVNALAEGNGSVPTTGAGIQVYDNYHVSVVGAVNALAEEGT